MITSIVAEGELDSPAVVPATHGEAMQREFFHEIAALTPGADRLLHGEDGAGVRPYTISPLMGRMRFDRGSLRLQPKETYWFRVTGLGETGCDTLTRLASRCRHWRLSGRGFDVRFRIKRWIAAPERRGRATWCGSASSGELWDLAASDMERQRDRVDLRFYSPTCFQLDGDDWGRWYPLPDPALVFESIRNRLYGGFQGLAAPPNWREVIRGGLAIGRHEVRSHVLSFQRHQRTRVGFTGTCEFLIHPSLPLAERIWLHLLAGAAFYTGVGSGTSWGMGQTRREPSEDFSFRFGRHGLHTRKPPSPQVPALREQASRGTAKSC
jgi:CRISPR-associated endoribonuclease Cas6